MIFKYGRICKKRLFSLNILGRGEPIVYYGDVHSNLDCHDSSTRRCIFSCNVKTGVKRQTLERLQYPRIGWLALSGELLS